MIEVYRVGVDLVSVTRVKSHLEEKGELQEAVFSAGELRYARCQRYPFQHLAARFAAKEAFFKAMGTGLSGKMDWRDVEVRKEASGKPSLHLSGDTRREAERLGIVSCHLSLSHTGGQAAALAFLTLRK